MRNQNLHPVVLPPGIPYAEKRRIQTIAGYHRATTWHAHRLEEAEKRRESARVALDSQAPVPTGEHHGFQHWIVLIALLAASINDYFLAGSALEFAAATPWQYLPVVRHLARFLLTIVIVVIELAVGCQRVRVEDDLASGLPVRRSAYWMTELIAGFLTFGIPALTVASNARSHPHLDSVTRVALLSGLALLTLVCHWQVIYGARSVLEALTHFRIMRSARQAKQCVQRLDRLVCTERSAMTASFQNLRMAWETSRLPVPLPQFDEITMRKLREVFGDQDAPGMAIVRS